MPRELDNKHVYAFSGCTDLQTCSDVYSRDNNQYQGAFTNAIITCLRNNHHNVGIFNLFIDVYEYLKAGGYVQTPVLSSSNKLPEYHFMRAQIQPNIYKYNCNEVQIVDSSGSQI